MRFKDKDVNEGREEGKIGRQRRYGKKEPEEREGKGKAEKKRNKKNIKIH